MKVDSGIPVPKDGRAKGRKYPTDTMAVGESFFVKGDSVRGIYNSARFCGIKVTCRRVTEDGVAGIRVWRVA